MLVIEFGAVRERKNIDILKKAVEEGDIFVYPTDTLYGLGGNFYSPRVHRQIDALKGRSDLPYSACVAGLPMIESLTTERPDIFQEIYEKLLPGKFTLLLKAAPSLPAHLLKGSTKIGIRLPDVPELLRLIEILGTPLISTSVNRSGEVPLNDPQTIQKEFPHIPLLIDAGPLPPSRGSTILDLTESPPKVIRAGDSLDQLQKLNIPLTRNLSHD
jgi:L-threonylcarbamoyladenylate synthase